MLTLLIPGYVSATSYTWNGGTSSNWATSSNWTPNGVPGSADNVTIGGAGIQPVLDASRTVTTFTINGSSTLNLNTYTLTITSTSTFTSGSVNNGEVVCTGTTVFSGTVFGAKVTVNAASVSLNGSKFNNKTSITKTGSGNINCTGGNKFTDTTTITSSGTGWLLLGMSAPDTFDVVTFTNSNTNFLAVAYSSAGNVFNGTTTFTSSGTGNGSLIYCSYSGSSTFNGNIIVNSYNGNSGIIFGGNGGATTLVSGKTISIGSSGYSSGFLTFKKFTQLGTGSFSFPLTGGSLVFGQGSAFGANIVGSAPELSISDTRFNGKLALTKTGSGHNNCTGGNYFADTASITNNGTGWLILGMSVPDTFNVASFTNSNTNFLAVAYSSAGNVFNGDVTFTNTGSGGGAVVRCGYSNSTAIFKGNVYINSTAGLGIYLSDNTGAVSLASGKTISVGTVGFTAGTLNLMNFTQLGSTAQTINLSGSATLLLNTGGIFNGALTASAPSIGLSGGTYNDAVSITKTGSGNNQGAGGCTFNSTCSITNAGTGYLIIGSGSSFTDNYYGDATFTKSSSGDFYIAYSSTFNFNGNVTLNSIGSTFITSGTGTLVMTGSNSQVFTKGSSTSDPEIKKLTINKSSGTVTFNTSFTVSTSLTLTQGILAVGSYGGAPSLLTINSGVTVTGGSNNAYITGRVKKTGNTAFTFPVGGANYYHPLSITAPSGTSNAFTVQYVPSAQTSGSSKQSTIQTLGSCDHWLITRNVGTSAVKVSAGYNSNCSVGSSLPRLVLAGWNGTQWINFGNELVTGNTTQGVITGSETNSFSSVTGLVIGTAKHTPWLTLNTAGLDTIVNESDTLWYTPSGANLSGTYRSGSTYTHEYSAPLGSALKQLKIDLFAGTPVSHTEVFCNVNASGVISDVRMLQSPDTLVLDTMYYDIVQDSILVLLNGGNKYEEQDIHPVKVNLYGGLTMSPDGDGQYDTFEVLGTSGITSYSLTINDMNGNTVYQTTNPLNEWDGTDSNNDLVPVNTYTYTILADGESISGQFTVEY
jgi:gliding motility-associated-like protein